MRTSGTTDCITINIVQDGILEFGEFFSIFVSSSDPNIVLPDPSVEIITIIDSNSKLAFLSAGSLVLLSEHLQCQLCPTLVTNFFAQMSFWTFRTLVFLQMKALLLKSVWSS